MNKNLGLYIHVPFCKSKCPYCDFYSISFSEKLVENYIKSLCKEIKNWSHQLKNTVDTVYFGGGTPSLLYPEQLEQILNEIKANFEFDFKEITVEINPADYNLKDFEKLSKIGISRISIGAQSFNDDDLNFLNRRHTAKDAIESIKNAKLAGFKNISADLIIGLPTQNEKNISNSLEILKNLEISHVSAYMLKIEKNTPFFKNIDFLNLPDDDFLANLYIFVCKKLKELGYFHYEISNWCKPGLESLHNLKYWNLQPYLGLGPAAHSYVDNKRFFYKNSLEKFIVSPKITYEIDNNFSKNEERLMLNLRLNSGVRYDFLKKNFNIINAEKFISLGFAKFENKYFSLTEKGWLVSNEIIKEFLC